MCLTLKMFNISLFDVHVKRNHHKSTCVTELLVHNYFGNWETARSDEIPSAVPPGTQIVVSRI